MGRFDLNNPIDFARATNSFGATIVALFTGRGSAAWALKEGAYQSGINPAHKVVFHVFESAQDYDGAVDTITDSGGRRKARFVFPYLDGQLTEDLGRQAETFNISILLHGPGYFNAFAELLQILNESVPGTLIHPVRGDITCAMESYEILHEERSRNAVAVRLTMIEHSLDALKIRKRTDKSAPSKLSKLTQSFKAIENAINTVQGAVFLVQSVKNTIVQNLQAIQDSLGQISGDMNATFNSGGSIPALLPVQEGGLQGANGAIVSNSTTVVTSPRDPFADVPPDVVDPDLRTALAIDQMERSISAFRQTVAAEITEMSEAGEGQGSLEFFDSILALREMVNNMQDAFEAGKQSSQVRLVRYVTPRLMTVREVAFENGLTPDDGNQIAILNPSLESLNYIAAGTELRVAVP